MKTTQHPFAWPPAFTVKKHPRARHVKLKASVKHGLELIVPKRFNQKDIPEVLERNRAWIEKNFLELHADRQIGLEDSLPNEFVFFGGKKTWPIVYLESLGKKIKLLTRPAGQLVLFGDISTKSGCKHLLIRWAKAQSRAYLIHELAQVSQATQLTYKNVIIRSQTSRWGSCTSDKKISLNYKLLFLPVELIRHILIHELCHTVHLNHSEKFWQLVAKFDPNWRQHRQALRKADAFIPPWVQILS